MRRQVLPAGDASTVRSTLSHYPNTGVDRRRLPSILDYTPDQFSGHTPNGAEREVRERMSPVRATSGLQ